MKPHRSDSALWGLLPDLGQLVYIVSSAIALSLCVYCLGKGKDLYAAYWAVMVLVAPRIEGWFRESE
jgi:hypothetical protein